MVEGDGVYAVEEREVVAVWCIVAVPADHVERAVVLSGNEQPPQELVHDRVLAVLRAISRLNEGKRISDMYFFTDIKREWDRQA